MNKILIKGETGKEIISLTLVEFMDLETSIISLLLKDHSIYGAQGRLNRSIHEYEERF